MITRSDETEVDRCVDKLGKEFADRILDELDNSLGIRVREHTDGLFLNQPLYLVNLMNRCGVEDMRIVAMSMETEMDF